MGFEVCCLFCMKSFRLLTSVYFLVNRPKKYGTCGGREFLPASGAKCGDWLWETSSILLQTCTKSVSQGK